MINMPGATESLLVMPHPRDAAFNDDKCNSSFVVRRAGLVLFREGDFSSRTGLTDAEEWCPYDLPAHYMLSHIASGRTTGVLPSRSFIKYSLPHSGRECGPQNDFPASSHTERGTGSRSLFTSCRPASRSTSRTTTGDVQCIQAAKTLQSPKLLIRGRQVSQGPVESS
jgi:hypothetical protein